MTLALFLATGSMQKTHAMDKGEEIARRAEQELRENSKKWAWEVAKEQRGNINPFPKNSPKCNLFVYDMLLDSGINPPVTPNGSPATAAMWKVGSFREKGFKKIFGSQQRGDVVSDGTHCGIAIDDGTTVAGAGEDTVNTDYPFYRGKRPTIQRYSERDEERF